MIGVRERPPLLMAMQYDGSNQPDVDVFVGSASRRRGDVLVNPDLAESHRISLNDWLVSEPHGVVVYGTDGFNARYERA